MTAMTTQAPASTRGCPDIGRFEGLSSEALEAFRADSSYAVAMARSASNILRKRQAYADRREG